MLLWYDAGMDDYMTVAEAAAALGISHRAMLNRIAVGDIQAVRVHARLWLVPVSEIDRWRPRGKLQPWQARRMREAAAGEDELAASASVNDAAAS